jgi:hypothetical protein
MPTSFFHYNSIPFTEKGFDNEIPDFALLDICIHICICQ